MSATVLTWITYGAACSAGVMLTVLVLALCKAAKGTPEDQAQEDEAQMAWLREEAWRKASAAYLKAEARGDTREMHRLWPAVYEAQVARLKAGV